MYGLSELKPQLLVTNTTVECPVRECVHVVPRQLRVFRRAEQYLCPHHSIYIGPSTFEFNQRGHNLLWTRPADIALLNEIEAVKRESRMARERSEDAVTWNVFRFLETAGLIEDVFLALGCRLDGLSEVIYWSYSQTQKAAYNQLVDARLEFGEAASRRDAIGSGSEPDLILDTPTTLAFVEVKFGSSNITPSSKTEAQRKADNPKKYKTGGNCWFQSVFEKDYETIVLAQKYELLRLWLLGSWIADRLKKRFLLVNLVLDGEEVPIEEHFNPFIRRTESRQFKRMTWESIFKWHCNSGVSTAESDIFLHYFRNKSRGYDGQGRLQRAFAVE